MSRELYKCKFERGRKGLFPLEIIEAFARKKGGHFWSIFVVLIVSLF